MKTLDIIRRSGRSLRQAKARTFLTASAIGVGAFALTMTLAATNGAQAYVNKLVTDNFDPSELVVSLDPAVLGQSGSSAPQKYDANFTSTSTGLKGITAPQKELGDSDLAKMRALKGVSQVREAISPAIQYVAGPNGQKYVATAYTYSSAQSPTVLAGKIPNPLNNQQFVLPQSYVKPLGFKNNQAAIGQSVDVVVQKGFNLADAQAALASTKSVANLTANAQANNQVFQFKVAAVYKPPLSAAQAAGTADLFYIGLDDARSLNNYSTQGTLNYHKYSYAYVRVTDGTNAAKLNAVETKLKSLGYTALSEKDTQQFLNQIITVLRGIVIAFGAIALIASIFGIVNTMYISVLQRTREIGLMKALGMRRREIGSLFRVEAAWIGFLGGLLGSLGAVVLGDLLNPVLTKKLDLDGSKLLIFKPAQIAVLIIILMIVAIVAGLLPARKASRLDPIEALRVE